MTNYKDLEYIILIIKNLNMKDNFKAKIWKVMAYFITIMAIDMKVNLKMIKNMVKENIIIIMEIYIKVNGKIIKEMEKVFYIPGIYFKIKFIKIKN